MPDRTYWDPSFLRALTDAEIETIQRHERLHRDFRALLKGRTSIGLPDHVADAAVQRVLDVDKKR
jgi:hypothetical protein